MNAKTSLSYMREVLELYHREKGGEMSSYLLNPTRKQIKEACLWLLNRRTEKYDEGILNRFFQFKEGENKSYAIDRTNGDRFKPIINFLTGETKSTTPANLEMIAWLIDFKNRPLSIYLKTKINKKEESLLLTKKRKKDETLLLNNKKKKEIKLKNLIPETRVIEKTDKSITIISQINPSLKITTIVSL